MSIFFPYNPSTVVTFLSDLFTIDLSSLTAFETLLITIISNLYFFIYWFFIIYFSLLLFNRLWSRIF